MPLSTDGRPPRNEAIALLRHVVESGVRLIDTADVYALGSDDIGHNETLIRDAFSELGMRAGDDNPDVVVATKGGMVRPEGRWEADGRPGHIRAACHASLTALGVERIDLYQLHMPDPRVPFAESVGAVSRLREEGKIGLVGLSNVSPDQIRTAAAIVPITSVQNPLSAWHVGWGAPPVVEHCGREGILFMAHSPFGGRGRAGSIDTMDVLAETATALGVTAHQVALAWLTGLGGHVVPIPGTRRRDGFDDNAAASAVDLGLDEHRALSRRLRQRAGVAGQARALASSLLRRFRG